MTAQPKIVSVQVWHSLLGAVILNAGTSEGIILSEAPSEGIILSEAKDLGSLLVSPTHPNENENVVILSAAKDPRILSGAALQPKESRLQ